MNRIEKLIQEHCPDGVEYKELGEIGIITIGEFVHKNKQSDKARYPVYNGGTTYTGLYNDFNNTANKIVISARGANAGYVNKVLVDYWAGNSCYSISFIDNFKIDWIFVYYYLKQNEHKLIGDQQKGGIPAVSKKMIERFKIPIPPFPVQQEIVNILDKFTHLEEELNAEFEARRKQYDFYLNQLMGFEDKEVEWEKLCEVAEYSKTRIEAIELDKNTYVGVDNLLQNKQGKSSSNYVPTSGNMIRFEKGDTLIGNIRPYLKKIWHATHVGGTNGDVLVVQILKNRKNEVNSKFLYYLLSSDIFFNYNMQFAKGAKMPRGDKALIMQYRIPIPPLSEQERIVSILDKFDALVNDSRIGIPAEIEARRKQYAYYRNKLLTFEEYA